MNGQPGRSFLEAAMAALPELARRAGRDVLAALDARVATVGGTLGEAVARTLVAVGQEREAALRRVEADTQTLRSSAAGGRSAQAVVELLERGGSAQERRQDRAALGRWLDASAIEDRLLLARHGVDQRWELLALVGATLSLEDAPPLVRQEVRRLALGVLAERTTRWPVRVASVRLLGALRRAEPVVAPPRIEIEDALEERAADTKDDPWVVDAALAEVISELSAEAGRAWLQRALEPHGAHRDHLFLRARVAGHAAALGLWPLLRGLLAEDGSEHVRMEAVAALARSPREVDRAVVLRHLESAEDWRVGARGAVALLDAGLLHLVGPALAGAGSERAARVVLDALWTRLREGRLGDHVAPVLRAAWSSALVRFLDARDPDVVRLADVIVTWARRMEAPDFAPALAALRLAVRGAREGSSLRFPDGPVGGLTAGALHDAIYLLAQDDLDLSAEPLGISGLPLPDARPPRGWRVHVGLRVATAAWRVRHETLHPRHDKRQAWRHTVDGVPAGRLLAWSAHLAEVVATTVPGQRVSTPTSLAWHEHLPLPANLLAAGREGAVRVRAPREIVTVVALGRGARWRAHARYVELAGLRERLVSQPRDEAVPPWDAALREAGFAVERQPLGAVSPGLGWLGAAGASDVGTFSQLALVGAASFGAWTLQKVLTERRIHQDRRAVPLVVGGWGSRGKSSVERLKGALFHGLGFVVLCKSTGCEAMVLVAIPGAEAAEVFLFRPRDKATIVENHTVLRMAAGLPAQVLLWECMALNPAYTQLLQLEWMRDDLSTITNTYPDHEDVQGPAGRDVSDVISEFTPRNGRLVSAEQQFAPVLARRAAERGSTFLGCRHEDWDLVPRDLIARFPYREYDRNVALVAGLAGQLGVPRDVAIRTMADHVLTDLGAFKVYGPVDVEGRTMSYAAGNSANDRASFLSNWERMDLDRFGPRAGLDDWLVTVINNRGDRLARQAVFAKIAALDICAERVVVIGTNVGPCAEAIHADLEAELAPRLLEIGHGQDGHRRLHELFQKRLRRRPMSTEEADAVVASAWPGGLDADPVRDAAVAAWREEVAWLAELSGDGWDVGVAIHRFVAFLGRRVLPFLDPGLSGDRILYDLAGHLPQGTTATLLGCANIKGTGLDLVYRWVSVDRVQGWLKRLEEGEVADVRDALERLTAYDGWGLYDARAARAALLAQREIGRFARLGLDDDAEAALGGVEQVIKVREAKRDAGAGKAPSLRTRLAKAWAQVDVAGSLRRRAAADRLYEDLAAQRVGLARAAVEAKHLVDGEKG